MKLTRGVMRITLIRKVDGFSRFFQSVQVSKHFKEIESKAKSFREFNLNKKGLIGFIINRKSVR